MPKHQLRGLPKGKNDPVSEDQKQICGAMTKARRHNYGQRWRSRLCQKPPVPGKTRCKLHGGASTGAKTPEGKARSIAAMIEGRQRWIEAMQTVG